MAPQFLGWPVTHTACPGSTWYCWEGGWATDGGGTSRLPQGPQRLCGGRGHVRKPCTRDSPASGSRAQCGSAGRQTNDPGELSWLAAGRGCRGARGGGAQRGGRTRSPAQPGHTGQPSGLALAGCVASCCSRLAPTHRGYVRPRDRERGTRGWAGPPGNGASNRQLIPLLLSGCPFQTDAKLPKRGPSEQLYRVKTTNEGFAGAHPGSGHLGGPWRCPGHPNPAGSGLPG